MWTNGSTQRRLNTVHCRFLPRSQTLSVEQIWGKSPRLPPLAIIHLFTHKCVRRKYGGSWPSNPTWNQSLMHVPFNCFPVLLLICRLRADTVILLQPQTIYLTCPEGPNERVTNWALLLGRMQGGGDRPTLASKKFLAPLTPSRATSISDSFARAVSPLSSCSSPAAALWKMSRNCGGRSTSLRDGQPPPAAPLACLPCLYFPRTPYSCVSNAWALSLRFCSRSFLTLKNFT